MNIVVLVKQVPDTGAARTLSQTGHTLDREGAELVLDEINERAAEEALRLKETADAHVTVISMGPDSALDARSWRWAVTGVSTSVTTGCTAPTC